MCALKEKVNKDRIITQIRPHRMLPQRVADSHKGTYGRVLLIVGSQGMAGAAFLAGMAAYRSGCGLVEIMTHASNRVILQQLLPEAVMTTYDDREPSLDDAVTAAVERADAVGIGCGLGLDDTAEQLVLMTVRSAISRQKPILIDADAITLIGQMKDTLSAMRGHAVVFTPHPKEMSALTGHTVGEIQDDRADTVRSFCEQTDTICLLKGHRSLVGAADEPLYENHTGNSGMAVGGSGDVLSGLITGLMAQGMRAYEAAVLGAWVHGAGGDMAARHTGEHALIARDILDGIVDVIHSLETQQD